MNPTDLLRDSEKVSEILFSKMKRFQPAIAELEFYEFKYGIKEFVPESGWDSVTLESPSTIEAMVTSKEFYKGINIKPILNGRIGLDEIVVTFQQKLFAGLALGCYSEDWVDKHFYFDPRSFMFYHRTDYFTAEITGHLGGKPYRQFDRKQKKFDSRQELGYRDFKLSNLEVDNLFIQSAMKLTRFRGVPLIFAIAGQTAAGKTEIVDRIKEVFTREGFKVTSIEIDNFLTDRDEREEKGIHSEGKEALHLELFKQALLDIRAGRQVTTPRYNFIDGTSSHSLDGKLKPGGVPIDISPAEIIFIEGNFPFLIDEIVPLIGIKVVYLTDDPIRLKRKWRRDMDLRKKYDLYYFRNRFFKDQFIMAQVAYLPQLLTCDIAVDTTGAAFWVTPEVKKSLDSN